MKAILNIMACILFFSGMTFFTSCKKDVSCEDCAGKNKLPIANAGADQTITLPKDSAMLDGSASTDTDGTLSGILATRLRSPVLNIATFKPFI